MNFEFLFWLSLAGIIVASVQDLKRREVDNWLNLFLIFSGLVYVFFGVILSGELNRIFLLGFLLMIMFVVMEVFYYGRVFGGGDAKLLFALTPFFLGLGFFDSIVNVGVFLLFLMLGGSVYGLFYSGVLWWKNRRQVNKEMKSIAREWKFRYFVAGGGMFFALGLIWNFVFESGIWLSFLGGGLIVFSFLEVFAKGLENVSMVREIRGSNLREGDWLVNDVKVGGRIVKADWEGLRQDDVELLKNKKAVLIKEGLPFVPAFLIAFVGYVLLRGFVIPIFIG